MISLISFPTAKIYTGGRNIKREIERNRGRARERERKRERKAGKKKRESETVLLFRTQMNCVVIVKNYITFTLSFSFDDKSLLKNQKIT